MVIGSLVNMATVVAGSLLGLALKKKFPENIRQRSLQATGLFVLVLGIQMALEMDSPILVISSMVIGGILGEVWQLERKVDRFELKLKKRTASASAGAQGNDTFSEGLITATLLYCVGSLTILGAIEEGLRNDPSLYYTKAVLDGITSVLLASIYGTGVLFSAIPVFLLQAGLTLVAAQLAPYISEGIITQISAVGGLILVGLGINLLEIKEIKIINFLPALLVVIFVQFLMGSFL